MFNCPKPNIFPGFTLEEYILWDINAIIDTRKTDIVGFNKSMNGRVLKPRILSHEQFEIIKSFYEPYRKNIEKFLKNYIDKQNNIPFIDYINYSLVFIPPNLYKTIYRLMLNNFLK